jgi:hypothetical protein
MALSDRKDGDAGQLARVQQFNKALEASVTQQLALAHETTEWLMLENPALRNSYAKAIICDSRGQHKDQRNRKRLALEKPVDIDAVEVKIVTPRTPAADRDKSTFDLY